MKFFIKLVIVIILLICFFGCKKEYIGPEVIITTKRTSYYNGTGAVLPYKDVQIKEQIDSINLNKDLDDKLKKAFCEFKELEKERQIVNRIIWIF